MTLCPACRADILRLPVADGSAVVLDAEPVLLDLVDEADRYLLVPASRLDGDVKLCLRRHDCPGAPPLLPPRSRDVSLTSTRADHLALRQLLINAELYRSQQLGLLRSHPGLRHYEPVEITPVLARLGRLDASRCVLCRTSLADGAILNIGLFLGSGRPALAHTPDCTRHPEGSPHTAEV